MLRFFYSRNCRNILTLRKFSLAFEKRYAIIQLGEYPIIIDIISFDCGKDDEYETGFS